MAGYPNGLLRFDRDREQFVMYGEREGLSASSVLGILEDRHGNLWVGTDGGLSRFNPSTKTFTNYYQNDGLASHAFEGSPAAFRSRRGQMFFGSTSGLTSFWPDQIVERPNHSACGPHRILVAERARVAGAGIGARKVDHLYALADAVP